MKKVRGSMTNESSAEKIKEMEDYLKGYFLYMKLLRMDRYEKEYFGYKDNDESAVTDGPVARAKMYEIRHFIIGMKNSDEKLLLYYHYIRGESVERCAELLGISRSSGFRLKKRALMRAVEHREHMM